MSIAGSQPGAQGDATIARVTDVKHSGEDSLHVTGRGADWHGAVWDLAPLVKANGAGSYTVEMYLKGTAGETLAYTVNFGSVNWIGISQVTLGSDWTRLTGTIAVTQKEVDAVNSAGYATLYPSGSGIGDYYIDDVRVWKSDADLYLLGTAPYAQGGSIAQETAATPFSGNDCLHVTGRTEVWHGAAWNLSRSALSSVLTADTLQLSMHGKSVGAPMDLTYNLEFWYNDGSANRYLSVAAALNPEGWTAFGGLLDVRGFFTESFDHLVIYPVSGNDNKNDYYLDAVSLAAYVPDDMSIGGSQPGVQGDAAISRRVDVKHSGNDSLLVTGRGADWHGAVWDLAPLVKAQGAGTYAVDMYIKGAAGEVIGYTVNFGSVNWLSIPQVTLGSDWTHLSGIIQVTENEVNAVNSAGFATLYPNGTGSSDYYIDDVKVWKTDSDTSILGVAPYAQGGSLIPTKQVAPAAGEDSLLVTGRTESWHGAAWSLDRNALGGMMETNAWDLSMQVRGDVPMDLTYNLEFWYNDGSANRYLSLHTQVQTQWTRMGGVLDVSGFFTDSFDRLVIYPVSGGTAHSDYYVDDVRLIPYTPDDMTVGGSAPAAQGDTVVLSIDQTVKHTGNDSILVSGRGADWHGATWNLAQLIQEQGAGTYVIEAFVKGAAGESIGYTVNFGNANWLGIPQTALTGGWDALYGTVNVTQNEVDAVKNAGFATLYPNGSGSSDYHIDAIRVWKVEKTMDLLGAVPYGQESTLRYVGEGLAAQNRTALWGGIAWSVDAGNLGSLKEYDLWNFSAQVKSGSGELDLTYSLEFWYSDDVSQCKYASVSGKVSDQVWTAFGGDLSLNGYMTEDLKRIVIYPVTGEGQLGDYILRDPAITGFRVDDMSVGPNGPASLGGASLSRVNDPVYTGSDSLLVTNRGDVWHGAVWNVAPVIQEGGLGFYSLEAYVKGTPGQTVTYMLNSGGATWQSAETVTFTDGWVKLTGTFQISQTELNAITANGFADLYPTTSDCGDYYIDAVKLTKQSSLVDDMTVGGNYYFAHGGAGSFVGTRVTDPVCQGSSALLVSNRTLTFAGAGWDVTALLKSGGAGEWSLSVAVRSVSQNQHLIYNIYLRYADGSEDWLACGEAYISAGSWSTLSGKAYSTTGHAMDFDNLESAVLYPCTDEGQFGDYYIDAVSFARTGDTIPSAPSKVADYTYDYYPIDGGFENGLGNGGPGYPFNHGGEVKLSVSDVAHSGSQSCYATDRGLPYSGPGYDVTAFMRNQGNGNYFFSAYAMAEEEPMNLWYSVYLRFEDGTEDWLFTPFTYSLKPGQWVRVGHDFLNEDVLLVSSRGVEQDYSKLVQATLYPCTGEGELGNFYLDDVSFYKGSDDYTLPVYTFETFPADGDFEGDLSIGAPGCMSLHGEGAKFHIVTDQAQNGQQSLFVTDRISTYSGAGWVVTDLLKQNGLENWYFSAYGKAAEDAGNLGISYSIYLRFNDGSENWLQCGRATYLTSKIWTCINADTAGDPLMLQPTKILKDAEDLEYAVLYPNTEGGALGNYYLDNVRLWQEVPEEEPVETNPPVIDIDIPEEQPEPVEESGVPVIALCAGGAALAAAAAAILVLVLKRRKKS